MSLDFTAVPPPQQGSPFHRALPSVHREPHAEALDRAFAAAFDFGAGGTAFFVAWPANKMSSVTVSRIADFCLGTNQDVGISSTLRLETQGYIDHPFQMASSYTLQTKVIKGCPFQIERKSSSNGKSSKTRLENINILVLKKMKTIIMNHNHE